MSGIECAFFGTLGRDGESKISKSDKPYMRLSIRVGDGDSVQWVSVMTFDAQAIAQAESLSKAMPPTSKENCALTNGRRKTGLRSTDCQS